MNLKSFSKKVLNKILNFTSALTIGLILIIGGMIHAIIFNNPNTVLLPILLIANALILASVYHERKTAKMVHRKEKER